MESNSIEQLKKEKEFSLGNPLEPRMSLNSKSESNGSFEEDFNYTSRPIDENSYNGNEELEENHVDEYGEEENEEELDEYGDNDEDYANIDQNSGSMNFQNSFELNNNESEPNPSENQIQQVSVNLTRNKRKRGFNQSFANNQSLNQNANVNDSLYASQASFNNTHGNFQMYEQNESIQVNCNSFIGELFKKKFGSGGKGSCIRVIVQSKSNNAKNSEENKKEEKWMTPIEFENYSGKGNCRDWKRTIKVGGQSLVVLMENNILVCHAVSCSCAACNKNESLVGPIRPFMRYRRRKKDEIIAQNAFKKFLSLKPPSLLQASMTKVSQSNNQNGNSYKELKNLSLPTSLCQLQVDANSSMNNSVPTSSFSEQTDIDPQINLSSVTSDSISTSNKQIIKNSLENQKDFATCLEEFEETEEKKWALLEQESNKLILQAQTLQNLIANTRKQSELNRKILIKKFFNNA